MKFFLLLSILFILSFSFAKGQYWHWAVNTPHIGAYLYGLDQDDAENIYQSGYFAKSNITIGSYNFVNAGGGSDLFLIKSDSSGNLIWAKKFGETENDQLFDLKVDHGNNVIITGTFSNSTINFDNVTLTRFGSFHREMYIAKLDSSGNTIWAKSISGNGEELAKSLAIDLSDNIYLTGCFASDSLFIDTCKIHNTTGVPTLDVFLCKLDSNGNTKWLKNAGGLDEDRGMDLATGISGNVYLSGYFKSDSAQFDHINLHSGFYHNKNLFIAKYDPNGNIIWARHTGKGSETINSIVIDNEENIYCTGYSGSDTLIWGNDTVFYNSVGFGVTQLFIGKCDSAGNFIWLRNSSKGFAEGNDLSLDGTGNLFVIGNIFSDTMSIGSNYFTKPGFFLAKYDTSGQFLMGIQYKSDTVYNRSGKICKRRNNTSQLVNGIYHSGEIIFDSDTLECIYQPSPDNYLFLAEFGCALSPPITKLDHELTTIPAHSYQWYLDGVLIPGANYQNYVPVASGDYSVLLTDSNGCTEFTSTLNYIFLGISTEEKSELIIKQLSTNEYSVFLPEANDAVESIKIFEITGKVVKEFRANIFELENLSKGIYLGQVETVKNKKYSFKISK
jgi:hypothetical protein